MGDRDLPSDSDSSDEDFVPEGVERELVSEDESANESNEQEDSEGENDGEKQKRKNTTTRKRSRKKLKTVETENSFEEDKIEKKHEELSAEDKKQKADSLWTDFLKDSGPPRKRPNVSEVQGETSEMVEKHPAKVKVLEEYDFAGEKVLVEKDVDTTKRILSSNSASSPHLPLSSRGRGRGRGGGGIASILGQLNKKNKLSTLEKSKLDWNMFKKDEGIEEDIEQHNKGKNGYLERQDFLERADLRQFEIEKNLRAAKRSSLR